MQDPSRDEMLEFLRNQHLDADEFEIEAAIYWFAHDFHDGQDSNLYEAICSSPYSPGILIKNCDKENVLYDALEREFGGKS